MIQIVKKVKKKKIFRKLIKESITNYNNKIKT